MRTKRQQNAARHGHKAWIYIILATLACALLLAGCTSGDAQGYLRLHIRADSNAEVDQSVKLRVRDAVVAYLAPQAQMVSDKEEMQRYLQGHLADIERVADEELRAAGMTYTAHAYLTNERFPTRTYGDLTLQEGRYDALVVALGSGEGANWWCVAFPPLCFVAAEETDTNEITYRSVIADWFANHCKER